MDFPEALTKGRLIKRYKRFLADVEVDTPDGATEVTAHCANPGSMLGLAEPGSTVWLSPNRNPKAKLAWRWELVEAGPDNALVCINTSRANTVVGEALNQGLVPSLSSYESVRAEVKYGKSSRIDFLLEQDGLPPAYVELKSVTLRRPDGPHPTAAEFPDSVTARGTKHLQELMEMSRNGARAVMLFLVQRGDCDHVRAADDIDPTYAETLVAARAGGVEIVCHNADVSTKGITFGTTLPIT